MGYLEILNVIKETAEGQPNINSIVREFTDLNREDIEYSAIVIQDRNSSREVINNQDYVLFAWHIGYVDRLTADEGNRDEIYSTGITVINNIIDTVCNSFFPQIDVKVSDRFVVFRQRFTAECAGVYCGITASVPVSDCTDYDIEVFESLLKTITSNGVYSYTPEHIAWNAATITVSVPTAEKEEEVLTTEISTNGSYTFYPSAGKVFSSANISANVHPSLSLSKSYTANGVYIETGEWTNAAIAVSVHPSVQLDRTYTSNGTYSETGEWANASINVDVHPSVSFVKTYSSNGVYTETGEWKNGVITVSTPEPKTEVSLNETINSNGTQTYTPTAGSVYSSVMITTDVHPSTAFTRSFTSNGVYTETGEWKDSTITVAVSAEKPEEVLTTSISTNGTQTYIPTAGYVFSSATITTDVHPSASLSRTYTSNGTYTETGEWANATVTVSVSGGGTVYYPGQRFGSSDWNSVPQELIDGLNNSGETDYSGIFSNNGNITTVPSLNTSVVTDMASMFLNCTNLITVPAMDSSSVTRMNYMFDGCNNLVTINGIDFSSLTSYPISFIEYQNNITHFIVTGSINFSWDSYYGIKGLTNIDYDSVKSILTAMAACTNPTTAKTMVFNRTMTDQGGELAALVADCTNNKGWTITGLVIQ